MISGSGARLTPPVQAMKPLFILILRVTTFFIRYIHKEYPRQDNNKQKLLCLKKTFHPQPTGESLLVSSVRAVAQVGMKRFQNSDYY